MLAVVLIVAPVPFRGRSVKRQHARNLTRAPTVVRILIWFLNGLQVM